jgi:S-formylglutathione hydrolase FrmB
MKPLGLLRTAVVSCCVPLLLLVCNKESRGSDAEKNPCTDSPRLSKNVTKRDVTFRSVALGRDMKYRVVLPVNVVPGERLPAVYLLHGGGECGYLQWSNWSDVARFAERRLILVMPEGGSNAHYTNSVAPPKDRYEDYVVNDLISDVEGKFPVAAGRTSRAIVGVSLGGFGAVKLALAHPKLFVFAGGISSTIDDASRSDASRPKASPSDDSEVKQHRAIFGPEGSQTRRNNDPFFLAPRVEAALRPYLFLRCGEQEGLSRANRRFDALLTELHFAHEFHAVPGGHGWNQWGQGLPSLFQSLFKYINTSSNVPVTFPPPKTPIPPAR